MHKIIAAATFATSLACAGTAYADPPPLSVNCKDFFKIAQTGAWHVLQDTSVGSGGDGEAPKIELKAGMMILPNKVFLGKFDVFQTINAKCSAGTGSPA